MRGAIFQFTILLIIATIIINGIFTSKECITLNIIIVTDLTTKHTFAKIRIKRKFRRKFRPISRRERERERERLCSKENVKGCLKQILQIIDFK